MTDDRLPTRREVWELYREIRELGVKLPQAAGEEFPPLIVVKGEQASEVVIDWIGETWSTEDESHDA